MSTSVASRPLNLRDRARTNRRWFTRRMSWSVRGWFQRRQRPAEPPLSEQEQGETPEAPTALTQFYEHQRITWEKAKAEFESREWPFRIVGDVSQWARTWLPDDLDDASPTELEAAYVHGEIPRMPFTPGVRLEEVVIAKAVEDGIVTLPMPGRLARAYVLRDPITELETAAGYGLTVADSSVLQIRAGAGTIEIGELGNSDGSPLHGAAAIERIVHQVIDTFAQVRPFLHHPWYTDRKAIRPYRQPIR